LSESLTLASRKLGENVAAALHARLADIDAARSPEELPLGFIASDGSLIEFALPLADDYVAIFESNHSRDREAPPGTQIVWNRVRRIKMTEVVKKNA
jgi:hypothetical protein